MSNLQKKLAARILKVGETKVWLDPDKIKDVDAAITKADVRKLISHGTIKVLPEKLRRPKEKARRRKGPGRRKGSMFAKVTEKQRWISTVRPLRKMLKELRADKQIDKQTYRKLYLLVKGGMFRNRSHLKIYMEQHGLLKKK
jgi:large subunit ribosomal protein L19e